MRSIELYFKLNFLAICRIFIALIFPIFVRLIETRGINFSCTYVDVEAINDIRTACVVNKLKITAANQTVTSVNDQVGIFRHYKNIKVLSVHHQTVHFLPEGIADIFPHLEVISIVNSNLKAIKGSDLKPFLELKELYLYGNKLEKLDSNLFESNPDIQLIDFNSNRLKFIGKDVLKPLTKLEYADFEGNNCINRVAGNRSEVEELINESEYECSELVIESKAVITSPIFFFLFAVLIILLTC